MLHLTAWSLPLLIKLRIGTIPLSSTSSRIAVDGVAITTASSKQHKRRFGRLSGSQSGCAPRRKAIAHSKESTIRKREMHPADDSVPDIISPAKNINVIPSPSVHSTVSSALFLKASCTSCMIISFIVCTSISKNKIIIHCIGAKCKKNRAKPRPKIGRRSYSSVFPAARISADALHSSACAT